MVVSGRYGTESVSDLGIDHGASSSSTGSLTLPVPYRLRICYSTRALVMIFRR
jgi:hypothetical protein